VSRVAQRLLTGSSLTGFRVRVLRIGKGGSKIKEIQEASGARLNASEQMLPGSTEVSGDDER